MNQLYNVDPILVHESVV